jgi:hypothetical protein
VRSCLSFVVFVALLLGVFAWVGLPALVGGGVQLALAASGFRGDDTTVDVRSDPPTNLLGGHADRLVIRSRDVRSGSLTAGSMDLTLDDVALLERQAAAVTGTLDDVAIADGSGEAFAVERVDIAGPSGAADATLRIAPDEVRHRAIAALGAGGLVIDDVRLEAPNTLAVSALGRTVRGSLVVDPDGALALSLPGVAQVALVAPPEDLPIRFRSVSIAPDGRLVIAANVDLRVLVGA